MKKKITIGLFNDTFYPMNDGVISVVDNYARRLMKYANVVVFVPFIPHANFDDATLPYKVVRCKSLSVPFLDYSLPIPNLDKKFKKELNKYKLDIVHIHSPFTIGMLGIKYAKKNNIPVIGTMHSQFKKDLKRFVNSNALTDKLLKKIIKVFNSCDECWAVNEEVARIFYEDYNYKCLPRVMNNATDMLPVNNKKSINYINKKYNIKKNEKVFLFVGRINKLKNIIFLADSLKLLKDKDNSLKFKMLFVGTGQDEKKLQKHIIELELQENIILCGKITDKEILSYYYKRADLFLFPSVYDASSIVQIEASSQKTPTLFIENTATASTIKNNETGFVSKNSIDDYSNRILEIMNNKELYNKVSNNCYKCVYKTWDNIVDKAYSIYIDKIKKY